MAPNNNPINVCANNSCEKPIFKGDTVWKLGRELYCHIRCVAETMREEDKK